MSRISQDWNAWRRSLTVGALALGLAACAKPEIVAGECRPVFGSDVCAWSESKGSELLSYGATVPIGAIENAPADAEMAWPPVPAASIPLPESVSAATGLKTLTIVWEPHGHPPGPYLTPHFDFHFYNLSIAEIEAIDCADVTKPSALPTGYALPDVEIPGLGMLVGLCVPKMGMHALLASALEGTEIFEKAMVVGYDKTNPIFVEPMLSRALLLKRSGFTLEMPVVPGAPENVRYPTSFRADYDSTANAYRFVFSGSAAPKMD